MSASGWRNLSMVLAVACVLLGWRACTRPSAAKSAAPTCPDVARAPASGGGGADDFGDDGDDGAARATSPRAHAAGGAADEGDAPAEASIGGYGFRAPAWVLWLLPHPGEDLLAYRDRMVPLVQAALAPHRARVARGRDDFAAAAGLDAHQKAELDAAVDEAASAIEDRVLNAALGGELMPSQFKPMTGVRLARDVLDLVDKADQRWTASLTDEQRARLAQHPFDLADYLLFSTRWEDAIGATSK